ncbi:MAG: HAD hydrolase family protein [Deltaproteobacteria bacterium]|nr:HAD hydrolase family protein [Deltaproteobacteria bacterium]
MNLDFSEIKILVFDVDGVLTDGRIQISESGIEAKTFFVHDGAGIRLVKKMGLKVGFMSAKMSNAAGIRAKELGVDFYIEGCGDKFNSLKPILKEYNLDFKNLFYMGDDVVDIRLLEMAGISASVPDAPKYVRDYADFITEKSGGRGAVREVCDIILEKKGFLLNFLNDLNKNGS